MAAFTAQDVKALREKIYSSGCKSTQRKNRLRHDGLQKGTHSG